MRRKLAVVLATVVVAVAGACAEEFEGGAACPSLCPEQNVELRDTIIEAIALDTSLAAYPARGTEPFLLLASRDGLDSRVIVRYDTLLRRFIRGGGDTLIYEIDSTYVAIRFDPARSTLSGDATIEVYAVDTTADDTSTAALLPLFRPDRLLGSLAVPAGVVPDSVKVPLSNAVVLQRIVDSLGIRLGIRVTGGPAQLRMYSTESGTAARLSYDPSPDTAVKALGVQPSSGTPGIPNTLAQELTDFTIIASGVAPAPEASIDVGGLPASRAFLRFDIPSDIVDSSTILRATLLLTQRPVAGAAAPDDSVAIYPQLVLASTAVTDLSRAATIAAQPGAGADSVRLVPSGEGLRAFEIVTFLRNWREQVVRGAAPSHRAIILRSGEEGFAPGRVQFHSTEAPQGLRPRLRISYVSRIDFGVP